MLPSKIIIVAFVVIFFIFAGSSYAYWQIKDTRENAEINIENTNINKSELEILEPKPMILPQEDIKVILPKKQNDNSGQILVQKCPDAWYDNRMPTIVDNPNEPQLLRQYFIYDGQRVETFDVDISWVVANCDIVKPSIVY